MALHKSLVKDVSPKAIHHAVLSEIAKKPIIIYPTALVLLEILALVFTGINTLSLIMIAVGMFLAISSWLWQYFVNGPKHALFFVNACQENIELKRRTTLDTVRKDMMSAKDHESIQQIDLFQHHYDTFIEALSSVIGANKLRFRRYLTIAEQVFLSGLDNLESAALAMRSVNAADAEHIEEALSRLENDNSDQATQEIAKHTARLQLRNSQRQRANTLLLENEQSLTQLDSISKKISTMSPSAIDPEWNLDAAMLTLQKLITRSKNTLEEE